MSSRTKKKRNPEDALSKLAREVFEQAANSDQKPEPVKPLTPDLYYEPRDYARHFEYPTQLGLGGKRN